MHIPVLQKEVIRYLNPRPNENFVDCTIGEGGHTLNILERNGPTGKVLGIDFDPEIIKSLELRLNDFEERVVLICDNFRNLKLITKEQNFTQPQGILFDLGMSSWHLEGSKKGFSFQREEPLDMRYNPESSFTAGEIINKWREREIEKVLREYGEERFSKRITKEIIKERKISEINNTLQLVEIIKKAVPRRHKREKIHLATRTFQALRIAVNDELNNIKKALPQALEIVKPGAVLVIISFHSLEDRIVKNFLRDQEKNGTIRLLTKKPAGPSEEELRDNPRSRSAKLRAAQKQ